MSAATESGVDVSAVGLYIECCQGFRKQGRYMIDSGLHCQGGKDNPLGGVKLTILRKICIMEFQKKAKMGEIFIYIPHSMAFRKMPSLPRTPDVYGLFVSLGDVFSHCGIVEFGCMSLPGHHSLRHGFSLLDVRQD